MEGIRIEIDQKSVDNAKKTLGKGITKKGKRGSLSSGLVGGGAVLGAEEMMHSGETKGKSTKPQNKGLASMLGKAIPIAALISLIKPIQQVLEVIGAVVSIGLAPLLPLLRIFVLMGVWIFKKLGDFIKGFTNEKRKQRAEEVIPRATGENFVSELYNKLLRPLLVFGGMIGDWIYKKILVPLFEFGGMIGDWIYKKILVPLFKFGEMIGQWLYDKVILPVSTAIIWLKDKLKEGWNQLMEGIKWVWRSLLKPVFETLWNGIKWVWTELIKPVWTWLKEKFMSIWDDIIKPIWDKIKDKFNTFKKVLSNIINAIKNAINSIPFIGGGKSTSHQDVLITKTGEVHDFSPNDNIMAFQGTPQMGGNTYNIKVEGFVGDEDLLAEKISKTLNELNRGVNF